MVDPGRQVAQPALLATLAGALANVYAYICLILLSFHSLELKLFLAWNVGGQRIPLFGRMPWCLLAQFLVTGIAYAWWRRYPPAFPRQTGLLLLALVVNALLIDALVLW